MVILTGYSAAVAARTMSWNTIASGSRAIWDFKTFLIRITTHEGLGDDWSNSSHSRSHAGGYRVNLSQEMYNIFFTVAKKGDKNALYTRKK